jgi:lipoprotein-anchoring transpeptidase ErfK/SrfK
MKHLLLLISFIFITSLQANIQDDRAAMMQVDRELFIAHKQVLLLKAQLEAEKKKFFNYGRIKDYEKAIVKYETKERNVQTEKDRLVIEENKRNCYMATLESQIPELAGDIHVKVNISDQIMNVYKGNTLVYSWFVSTAMEGLFTPTGNYNPYHTEKMHYSKQFYNSPMPYAVFFKEGFAIHGTEYVRSLGYKASHGCVRLHTDNAYKLYSLVQKYGYDHTFISIKS